MKPKTEDQRYQETLAAIKEAIISGNYPPGVRLRVALWWGNPKCHVMHSTVGPLLDATVQPDWLERVHQHGLAMVDGVLVLHAEEAPPIEGVEEAWLCVVCVHKADWSEAQARNTYVIRFAGDLYAGIDQQEAMHRALKKCSESLGVDPPEDTMAFFQRRAVCPIPPDKGEAKPEWKNKFKLKGYISDGP